MFTSVLLIEQQLSAADVKFVTTLHDDETFFVVLMQPRGAENRLLRSLDDIALGELERAAREGEEPEGEEARQQAALALEHSVRSLREAGSESVGQLVGGHPLTLLRSVVEETGADEVIVLTAPHLVEELLHLDWAGRARHTVGVPVLKLYAHDDER
ncbi:indole-3-glycerol phosphate synthase [Streptomyces sp. Ru62]|uniref:indole-3-glycerol phosphate synthase n=1 Tax=Streptomyces sp. Ru62 TaxID=2080745 RepID=UPI000CDDBA12|nr:indole-3-glycerol phosphate synthase [Streptomyces sp. Ru62]POX63651.1 indole-3-glycerol phosphate synthase [Streptomyces sp. Ru62]